MSVISLENIQPDDKIISGKIKLKDHQLSFIETIDECLEEARECSAWRPVAIYADDVLVGFAMYGFVGDPKEAWIDRIMIDSAQQGKGLGQKAMMHLIDVVTKTYDVGEIYLSFVEGNDVAKELYEKLGFKFTGKRDPQGELIYRYEVGQPYSQ
ncbi:GNAT family N-acetyltransferase [Salinicoccus jeotgali]|uniref:GNAT family N-acetyltransferase n=1 Tax=Salinicoccus jeotgali TaxID=381634 RepID=A0ABP7E4W7_9STAP